MMLPTATDVTCSVSGDGIDVRPRVADDAEAGFNISAGTMERLIARLLRAGQQIAAQANQPPETFEGRQDSGIWIEATHFALRAGPNPKSAYLAFQVGAVVLRIEIPIEDANGLGRALQAVSAPDGVAH